MRTCVRAQTRARVCGCVCGVGVIVGDGEEVFQERVMFDLNLEAWLGVHQERKVQYMKDSFCLVFARGLSVKEGSGER